MIKTISNEYKRLCIEHHSKKKNWGASGGKWTNDIAGVVRKNSVQTILDYGSGKGALSEQLRNKGFQVTEYDPAVEEIDIKPITKFDLILCVDVLEHIEPDYLDVVLQELHDYAPLGYFVICLGQARKHWLNDGRNAHLIVKSRNWWAEKLKRYWFFKELEGRGWEKGEMVVEVRRK